MDMQHNWYSKRCHVSLIRALPRLKCRLDSLLIASAVNKYVKQNWYSKRWHVHNQGASQAKIGSTPNLLLLLSINMQHNWYSKRCHVSNQGTSIRALPRLKQAWLPTYSYSCQSIYIYSILAAKGASGPLLLAGGPSGHWTLFFVPSWPKRPIHLTSA